MAITITPKYKPFTYEELVKPLEGYWKDYDKAEDDLEAARADVAKLKPIIEALPTSNGKYSDADQLIVDKYNSYLDNLNSLSEKLSTSGLTSDTKRQIKGLKASYNDSIDPMFGYIKERKADQAIAKAALEKGDTIYAAYNPFTAPLSEYANPHNRPHYHTASISTLERAGISIGESVTSRMQPSADSSKNLDDYDAIVNGILEGNININTLANDSRFKDYIQNERNKIKYDTFDEAGKAQIDAALIGGIAKGIKGGIEYKRHYDNADNPSTSFQPFKMGDRTYVQMKKGYLDITDPNNVIRISPKEFSIIQQTFNAKVALDKTEEENKKKELETKINNVNNAKERKTIVTPLGDLYFLSNTDAKSADDSDFDEAVKSRTKVDQVKNMTAQDVIGVLLGDLREASLDGNIDIHSAGSGNKMYIVPQNIATELKEGVFKNSSFQKNSLIIGIGGGHFGDYKFASIDADVLIDAIKKDNVLSQDTWKQKKEQILELIRQQLEGKPSNATELFRE